jgi:hypothetical protein
MAGLERMRAAHAALALRLGLPADASEELQFAAHLKHALAQSGPRIKSAIGRCDGVVVAGRRFVELMHALRMYARDVASVVSGEELRDAEFVAFAVRALVPAGCDSVLPRVLFDSGQEEMAAAYRLVLEETPALVDDACLLALVGGTPAAAAFLEAGGDDALSRLASAQRGGVTALEVLLDALQFGSFFHCGGIACRHASALLEEWAAGRMPPGGEADAHRALHRLARSGGLVGADEWARLCKKAALAHEARSGPVWATQEDLRHAASFWADVHDSAASVLTLGRCAAAKRQRRTALFTWFFSRSTLYVSARVLMRPGVDALRWVMSAALEAETAMRAALNAADKLPGGGPRTALETLKRVHCSESKFDVAAVPGDEATACVAAAVKAAEGASTFFCGMGRPKRSVVSAIVTF